MTCKYCNAPLQDDAKFCQFCGSPVEKEASAAPEKPDAQQAGIAVPAGSIYDAPEVNAPVNSAPVTEDAAAVNGIPAAEEVAVNNVPVTAVPAGMENPGAENTVLVSGSAVIPGNSGNPEKPKKSKKGLIIAICCILAVAVLAGAGYFVYSRFFAATPAEKFSGAICDVSSRFAESAGEIVDMAAGRSDKTGDALSFSVKAELGDTVTDVLSSLAGTDLDFMKSVSLTETAEKNDGLLCLVTEAALSGDKTVSLNTVFNENDGKLYVSVPELSGEYLYLDFSGMISDYGIDLSGLKNFSIFGELTGRETEKLLMEYVKTAADSITAVTEEKEVLSAGNISTKATVLKAQISEKSFYEIAEAVLKKADGDKELKDIIIKLFSGDMIKDNLGVDAEDVYDELKDFVGDTLEDIADSMDYAETDTYITVKIWQDGKENIGFSVVSEDEYEFRCFRIRDGKKSATLAEVNSNGDTVSYLSEGTVKKGLYDGTANLSVCMDGENTDIVTLVYEGLDTSFKNGFNGGVTVSLGKDIGDMLFDKIEDILDSDLAGFLSLLRPEKLKIRLDGESGDGRTGLCYSVCYEDIDIITLTVSADAKAKSTGITESSLKGCDILDEDELAGFFENIDADGFEKALKDAGVPKEYASEIGIALGTVKDYPEEAAEVVQNAVENAVDTGSYYDPGDYDTDDGDGWDDWDDWDDYDRYEGDYDWDDYDWDDWFEDEGEDIENWFEDEGEDIENWFDGYFGGKYGRT